MNKYERNKIDKSCVVPIVERIIIIISKLSIYEWVVALKKWDRKDIPARFTELYIFIWVVSIITTLISIPRSSVLFYFVIFLSIYRLIDILIVQSTIIFINFKIDKGKYYIETRNPRRLIILSFINMFEVVLCFSVLFLACGNGFCKPISDCLTAFYQSIQTITTLGYGEIHANNALSKLLVIFQLLYFLYFFFLILPRIFSAIQVKQKINRK